MRSFLTLGAATIALAIAAPALAQTTAPAAPAQDPAAATATTPAPAGTAAPAGAAAPATPAPAAPVTAGQPVKDNSGAVIGSVAEVKPDATGKSMATIKMDDKTFAVDVANLAVSEGATLINASKAELEGMLAGAKK